MKKLFVMMISAVLFWGLAACVPAAGPENARTLSVSGSGQAFLTPDIARISIGVRTEEDSAESALAVNTARAERIAQTLIDFGVDEKDIQTRNFSIYRSDKRDLDSNVVGVTYTVNNTVYVTVRDLDTFGELLDTLVKAGANNINNIQFDVDDKTAAFAAARDAAIADARAQAESVAAAAGVTLGEVQTISFYDSVPMQVRGTDKALLAMAADSAVPIQAGETSVTVTVSVIYAIK